MKSGKIDEALLVRYLLGRLSEEKQVEVEDRAFADAAYRSALESAEADLIDAYVRGELSQDDRRAFEVRFLTSPQRRSKVEFAQALAAAPRPAWEPVRPWFSKLFQPWMSSPRFAVAFAVLICVASISWLLLRNRAVPSQAPVIQASREPAGEKPVAAVPPRPVVPAPLIATLVLSTGISRGESQRTELLLDPSIQTVHIEVELESRDDYPKFSADLRTAGGTRVATRSGLSRRRTDAGFGISFDVPASLFKAGQYELGLKGVRDGEPEEDISYSYFRVRKP